MSENKEWWKNEKKPHLDKKMMKLISADVNSNILKEISKKEQSAEYLSIKTGYSERTIHRNLKVLCYNNLVVRKKEEGRKFVTYIPTKFIQKLFTNEKVEVTISL